MLPGAFPAAPPTVRRPQSPVVSSISQSARTAAVRSAFPRAIAAFSASVRRTGGCLDGVIPFAPSFDVAGWFARDAAVFERVGHVLMDADAVTVAPRRLLVLADAFGLVEPAVTSALAAAVQCAKTIVPDAEEIDLSGSALAEWFEVFKTIQASEVWANHGAWIKSANPSLGPGVKERIAWACELRPGAVTKAKMRQAEIRRHVDAILRPGDVLCLPTSPRVAPLRNSPAGKIEVEYREQAMRLLCISGLNGLPQISLPLGILDGLPLGLSLAGPRGSDLSLLALARKLMPNAPAKTARSKSARSNSRR